MAAETPSDSRPVVTLEMDFHFSAAHRLPHHPGKCATLHGHNYLLRVSVRGRPDPHTGILIDFGDLDRVVREAVLERCDHRDLNEHLANPTAENIVVWAWERLAPALPGLVELRLWEVKGCCVVYRGEGAVG